MLFNILAIISTFIVIIFLKRLVNIFPSLMACTTRWKESVNLEASVKYSFDRDIVALAMILPFCLAVGRFRLYDPAFMGDFNESIRVGITTGVFLIYLLIRRLAYMMLNSSKIGKKTYVTADKSSYTFFILLTLLLLLAGGVLSFLHMEAEIIRIVMLWISAFMYGLSLLRKTQIFVSKCSIFAGILYLCALEIIPSGLLIASALIF